MLSFNHPNVMSLIGLCIEGEMPLLIMPFMSNGSLLDYVRQNREKLFTENSDEVGFIIPIICQLKCFFLRLTGLERRAWICVIRLLKAWLI